MEKEFTLKKYDTVEELFIASYAIYGNVLTTDELKEITIVGLDEDEKEIEITFDQQKNGILTQGYWGWVDENKVIHYWIGKNIPMEELIHFFAHEIGHRTGKNEEDDFQEEMRAEGYGFTATKAYEFAKQIKKQTIRDELINFLSQYLEVGENEIDTDFVDEYLSKQK